MKMQVTVTPDEIKKLVQEHLQTKFSIVGNVKLEVARELVGNQMHEHYETVFKGATCEVDM